MGSFTSEILLSLELDILFYWISLFIFICTFSGNGNHTLHFKNGMPELLISDI